MGPDYGTGVQLDMCCRQEGPVLFWIFTYLVLHDGGLGWICYQRVIGMHLEIFSITSMV